MIRRLGVEDVYEIKLRTPKRLLISDEPGSNMEQEIAPGRYIQTAISNVKKAETLLDAIERCIGLSSWDNGWIVKRILEKLEENGRVETRRTRTGRSRGWKLTAAEASRRQ